MIIDKIKKIKFSRLPYEEQIILRLKKVIEPIDFVKYENFSGLNKYKIIYENNKFKHFIKYNTNSEYFLLNNNLSEETLKGYLKEIKRIDDISSNI